MKVATNNYYPKDGTIRGNPSLYRDSKFVSQLDEVNVLGTFHLPCSQGVMLLGLRVKWVFGNQYLYMLRKGLIF